MKSFFWFNYIISVLKKYLKRILILGDFIKIELESLEKLNIVLSFLKNHSKTKFNLLVDIACVDFLNFKNNRFQMNYLLLSCFHNSRLTVSFWLNEKDVIQSSTNVFSGAN
jgi:NADH:ubiquinone oxidoreductase subunit C